MPRVTTKPSPDSLWRGQSAARRVRNGGRSTARSIVSSRATPCAPMAGSRSQFVSCASNWMRSSSDHQLADRWSGSSLGSVTRTDLHACRCDYPGKYVRSASTTTALTAAKGSNRRGVVPGRMTGTPREGCRPGFLVMWSGRRSCFNPLPCELTRTAGFDSSPDSPSYASKVTGPAPLQNLRSIWPRGGASIQLLLRWWTAVGSGVRPGALGTGDPEVDLRSRR